MKKKKIGLGVGASFFSSMRILPEWTDNAPRLHKIIKKLNSTAFGVQRVTLSNLSPAGLYIFHVYKLYSDKFNN